jgi:Ca2+-binding RTX toxin-like protein
MGAGLLRRDRQGRSAGTRAAAAVAFFLGAFGLVPSIASAASVVSYVDDGEIRVTGDDGVNDVSLSEVAGRVVVSETGISTDAPLKCNDTGDSVDCDFPPGEPTAEPGFLTTPEINFDLRGGADLYTSTLPDVGLLPRVHGGVGNDQETSGPSPDDLYGDDGEDALSGGDGNDHLDGGKEADQLSGGGGDDLVSYFSEARTVGVIASPNGLPINGSSEDGPEGARDAIGTDVESLVGSNRRDTLTGTAGDNFINGAGGADVIRGLAGRDDVDGGTGPRNLVVGGRGDDNVSGGGNRDRLLGGRGNDDLDELDRLIGGVGIDTIRAADGKRDAAITCGPGNNRRESAERDRIDPPARSC